MSMSNPRVWLRGRLSGPIITVLRDSHVHNPHFFLPTSLRPLSSFLAMPASKAASANGSTSGKTTKGTPTAIVPPSPGSKPLDTDPAVTHSSGRPDKNGFDAEQERLKSEIDALQTKLVRCIPVVTSVQWPIVFSQGTIREKISLATKPAGNDRRNALRTELESIREQQSSSKTSRGKVLDQLKALQDGIQKKVRPHMLLP